MEIERRMHLLFTFRGGEEGERGGQCLKALQTGHGVH